MSYSFAGRFYNKYKPLFSYEHKDYCFKVDMEYGELYFTKKLISFSGKHLPLDLSLKYIQRHVYDYFYADSSFPLGFKTNFHIFLEFYSNNNKYAYEDADGFYHEFELAIDSSSLYFDSKGSGLMLMTENNGFKVFDDNGNYQLFDQYGRLVTIHKKITATHHAEQTITYSSGLTISSITDNYGRAIYFSYTGSGIQISYGNNVVITLQTTNNRLFKISKNIDYHVVEETFDQYYFINSVSFASGECLEFSYTGNELIYMKSSLGQDAFNFSYYQVYDQSWATVTNARGISTRYDFNEKQILSRTSDNNVDLSYLKIDSDILSSLIKDVSNNDEITDFLFNNQTSIEIGSYSFGSSSNITNNNLQPKKIYLFIAEIEGNLGNEYFELRLFDSEDNYLGDLKFEGKNKLLACPIGIKASAIKTFHVDYLNFCFGNISILKARIVPLIGDFEMLCSSYDINGPVFFYGNTPYYLLPIGIVGKVNNEFVTQQQIKVDFSDYIINEKMLYKSSNSFCFWANNQKKLFEGCLCVYVWLPTSRYLGFDLINNKIALYDSSLVYLSDLDLLFVKGKDDNSFIVTKKSHNSASFHTGYTTYYYEEQETKYISGNNGYSTYYDYDDSYSLIELNRDDGYKEENSYDAHGNLLSKSITHSEMSKRIEYEYGYDNLNDVLLNESKLIGTSFSQTSFAYDVFGNLLLVQYPNGLEEGFAFDNVSGERKTLTYFYDDADDVEFAQFNNYLDDDSNSLSTDDNEYLFNYDDGNLVSVSYNNQTILTITHNVDNYNGVLLSSSQSLLYSNAINNTEALDIEYDAFDRVISNDGLFYEYDDFSKITNIYDDNLGGFSPYTYYTYDYYGDLSSISVENNDLSLSFSRDIYRRLTNKTYSSGNSALYSVSYTYYSLFSLENAIKKSTITYNSVNIEETDNIDSFSRLTNQSISFNNCYFSKSIQYYVGGQNNAYTNSMIKSVTYQEYTPPSGPIGPGGLFGPSLNLSTSDVYSYDVIGNITSVARHLGNTIFYQIDYVYDTFSRLIRENNPLLNKTYTFTYDNDGNITSKKEYSYSTSQTLTNPINTYNYTYDQDFPNRLAQFGTQQITYDTVGNPTTYRGKQLSWTKGTLLSHMIDGNKTIDLTYDGFKQRISKTITELVNNNEIITDHFYSFIDDQLIEEIVGTKTITYLYSHRGLAGFVLSGYSSISGLNGTYLYEKNIQQDVVAIRNINNEIVAKYQYDAWGNHKVLNSSGVESTSSSFIGNINPIRYRSYYYDTDLKMYWLKTRYYDPEIGRFISPDHYSYLDYQKLHGLNLYAYSKNNPVMYYDPSGHFNILFFSLLCVVACAVVSLTRLIASTEITSPEDPMLDTNTSTKKIDNSVDLGNGVIINYEIKGDWDKKDSSLKILDSWKYTQKQIEEFVDILIKTHPGSAINKKRIVNEWAWHKNAYYFGYGKEEARSADIFLDAKDVHKNKFVSFIMNYCWWFY